MIRPAGFQTISWAGWALNCLSSSNYDLSCRPGKGRIAIQHTSPAHRGSRILSKVLALPPRTDLPLQTSNLVCLSPRGCCCCLRPPVWVAAFSLRHMKVPRVQLPQDFVSCSSDSDTGKRARGRSCSGKLKTGLAHCPITESLRNRRWLWGTGPKILWLRKYSSPYRGLKGHSASAKKLAYSRPKPEPMAGYGMGASGVKGHSSPALGRLKVSSFEVIAREWGRHQKVGVLWREA